VLRGGAGRDRLDGGAGIDTADFSDAGKAVVLTLNGAHQARARIGGAADDMLKNIENAMGGKRGDQLTGDNAANVLMGNGGSDILAGGLGADTLGGGAGRDRFVFDTKLKASNVDTILDFTHNADRIALDAGVFKAIGPSLSSNEFRAGAGIVAGLDRNDRVVYDTLTGAVYYDRDGNKPGGAAAIQFATLAGAPSIDAGDFLIV
jgi:Ca2+-binding RTX toxin-like protein